MAMPAGIPAAGAPQRIAFVCPPGAPLQQLREHLFGEILSRRHRILVVAPQLGANEVQALAALGAEHASLIPEAADRKLMADWKAVGKLKQVLADWAPHVVVAYGAKTMIYGALAAKSAGVERVVLVVDGLPEQRFTGALAADEMPAWRYGQALRAADAAVFHNRDDLGLMQKLGAVPEALRVVVVPGAGIDLERQPELPLPPLVPGLAFLMIASLDERRGVVEYATAAATLRQQAPGCRFLLAGLPDAGAATIDVSQLTAGGVDYVGDATDHAELFAQCHVFVYPAHAEGMPQPVLQALAAGRPILTTDIAGCRDTVDERINGTLVPARDAAALAEAMQGFLKRPDLIPAMARASRAKAERFCSADSARRSMLDVLQLD
jgi:glycosyltransferase involved in cell wall biosynthesis